jgi:cyclase
MVQNRIIPTLLLHNNQVYKTMNFKNPIYVGEPINIVRIFNEKQVDEILILDIDVSKLGKLPNFELVKKIAAESEMPVTYGGGICEIWQADKIISSGIEKISISSAAILNPNFLQKLTNRIGSQSVSITLDILKVKNDYELRIFNGTKIVRTGLNQVLDILSDFEVCEFIVNSIDRDGTMTGYDLFLADKISKSIKCHMTLLGGAGSINDFVEATRKFGHIGLAAGSFFVFRGKFRAVLPSYISLSDRILIELSRS